MSESYKQLLQAAEDAAALMDEIKVMATLPMSISIFVQVTNVSDRLRKAINAAHGEQS